MEPTQSADPLARILDWGLCALIVLAPLPFGSVVPWARGAVEVTCVLLGVLWSVRCWTRPSGRPGIWLAVAVTGLLGLATLQLLPLPPTITDAISPASQTIRQRIAKPEFVSSIETELLGGASDREFGNGTLSLDPTSTASALRTGIAMAAVFLIALLVGSTRGPRNLLIAMALSVSFQGLYGLLVVASGHDRIWNVPKQFSLGSATGSWINPSHYSGYLAACLPALMAWMIVRYRKRRSQDSGAWTRWLTRGSGGRTAMIGIAFFLGLSGLMTSFSRAGIVLGVLALGVVGYTTFRRRRVAIGLGLLLLVVLAAAIPLFQLDPDRLVGKYSRSADELIEGNRPVVWKDTLQIVADSLWVGTGFGTFAAVYPVYRSPEIRLFYAHAHNDALQVLAEGGLIGFGFLLLLAWIVLVPTIRSMQGAKGTVACGLAAGLMTVVLHSWVDFPFHLPANAVLAAVLAGFVLGIPWRKAG